MSVRSVSQKIVWEKRGRGVYYVMRNGVCIATHGTRDEAVAFITVPGFGNLGKMRNGRIMHQPIGGKCWHIYED